MMKNGRRRLLLLVTVRVPSMDDCLSINIKCYSIMDDSRTRTEKAVMGVFDRRASRRKQRNHICHLPSSRKYVPANAYSVLL